MTIDVYLHIICESVKYERYEVRELAYLEAATMSNEASTLKSIYTIFISSNQGVLAV